MTVLLGLAFMTLLGAVATVHLRRTSDDEIYSAMSARARRGPDGGHIGSNTDRLVNDVHVTAMWHDPGEGFSVEMHPFGGGDRLYETADPAPTLYAALEVAVRAVAGATP